MAPEKSPAFQFYVKDWRSSRSIMRMSFSQRGMYLEMLLEQWESKVLPDDSDAVAELIGGSKAEWRRAWPNLRRKFAIVDGGLQNAKLEDVRTSLKKFKDTKSASGKAGAEKRWHKNGGAMATPSARDDVPLAADSSSSSTAIANKKELSVPPKEPADPRVREFLKWFQMEYKLRRAGADYLVKFERDSPLVKVMLKTTSYERLQDLAKVMLSDKCGDKFIVETDRGIGILSTKFNWLSDRLSAWEARHA